MGLCGIYQLCSSRHRPHADAVRTLPPLLIFWCGESKPGYKDKRKNFHELHDGSGTRERKSWMAWHVSCSAYLYRTFASGGSGQDEVTFLRLRGTALWRTVEHASSLRTDCLLRDACRVSRHVAWTTFELAKTVDMSLVDSRSFSFRRCPIA